MWREAKHNHTTLTGFTDELRVIMRRMSIQVGIVNVVQMGHTLESVDGTTHKTDLTMTMGG